MNNDFSEQKKTMQHALDILNKTKRCCIIRPTGFGKTYILTELIAKFKKVLYLYPAEVVRNTVIDRYYDSMYDSEIDDYIDENGNVIDPETIDTYKALKQIDNCDLMTYAKLIRLTNDELKAMKYDLILFDECHRLGGFKTKIAVDSLMAFAPKKTRFLGATATPTRMDNFDVVSYFFNDNTTYSYTLFDAIENGLLQKPNYCYCTENPYKDIENSMKADGIDTNDPDITRIINRKAFEIAQLNNMPKIIKNLVKEYQKDKSYMKWIIFFASKKHMADKIDDVVSWFSEAYPKHTVNTLRISSNSKEKDNVDLLDDLQPHKNTIDLIACIDMLNMGYHVNNLTGILMYRGTQSSTIFIQQLGRALSVGTNNSSIVIDVVDNLHKKAAYNIARRPNKKSSESDAKTSEKLGLSKNEKINPTCLVADENNEVWNMSDPENPVKTAWHVDSETGNVLDKNNLKTNKRLIPDSNIVVDIACPSTKENVNQFTEQCFNMSGYMATYRDIIAKAVAEPMTQRCKYALELHFRTWCMNNGIPYPISDQELTELYNKDKEEFYQDFIKILKKNKIPYNVLDAKHLLQIGTDDDGQVPLSICAKARNVSVEQILDVFQIPDEKPLRKIG